MNPGLNIFKRAQRLQGGEKDVPLAGRAARKVQDLSLEALENLPEWLKKPIRQGVGRVATNVIAPFDYTNESRDRNSKFEEIAKLFSPEKLRRTIESIAKDQPAYRSDELDLSDTYGEQSLEAGRPLFREYFDLPTQDVDKIFIKDGKDYRINPETKNQTAQDQLTAYRKDLALGADQGQNSAFLGGHYFPGQPDPWDFDLRSYEEKEFKGKPLPLQYYGRKLLQTIGKPAVLQTSGYHYNPPPEEDVDAAQNTGGGLARGTANVGLGVFKRFQKGSGDVMDLERGNWPVSEEELKTLPDWLAHLLRGIPEKHTHGSQREQFMPRSVPVMQGPQGRYYDPRYSADDERIMAKEGDADIEPLKLASGSSNLPKGFTAFWPGGGRWEGPSQVAAGSNILGGHPWQYYDIGNPNAPWIGLEGPRGSLGQWVDVPGESRRGRVIDVKQKGYGGYGILKKGQYDRRGNWIPGSGGGGGTIPGGPFEGWTPQAMEQWHSGTPPSGMNYPEFTGNTAGPGGQQLAYETTSYNIPGYGWVPRATLANAQASNNLWDYLNPFGGTSKGGSGTGDPTQRAVGTAVGTATNFIIPGLGFVTGPIARYVTSLFQKNPGITREQIVQAVAAKAKEDPAMVAPPAAPSQGSGFDPWGNPDRGNNWSNDFGRGLGGPSLSSAGGTRFGQLGTGFGTGTVGNFATAIGFGGNLGGGGPVDASRYRGASGYSRPFSAEQWANMQGKMKYPAPAISGAWGGVTPQLSYQQYLQGFHAPGTVGSSTGPGGAAYGYQEPKQKAGAYGHTPKKAEFAIGTSDVNLGLKIFHKQQLKRKKQT